MENMKKEEIKSALILLLTAAIWGFAFVAQRVGMQHLGAFLYNGIRFALGSLSLLPVIYFLNKNKKNDAPLEASLKETLKSGIILGMVLFIASSFQQVGIIYTTAGKAGFITTLYIVLVPIAGIFFKHKTHITVWIGAFTSVIGLYLLSVNENFTIQFGDLLQIIGALFWTIHILLIDKFVKNLDPVKLSATQFATSSVLSLVVAFAIEDINLNGITGALVPILYGGIMSVGVAYTLQTIGQRLAKPSHAAIALSMEAVFAAIGGSIILNETLSPRAYFGCFLMLCGMLIAQINNFKKTSEIEQIN